MLPHCLTPLFFVSLANAVRELCGQYDVYTQKPYLWNNNVWNADDSGSSCTYIPDDPESESNTFEVVWQWSGAPAVRGYPHVEFKPNMLPIKLSSLSSLVLDASWEMAPISLEAGASHDPTTEPNASSLKHEDVEANVCIDIFADPDKKTSTVSAKQMYEIMIWFGQFGKGSLPVGNTDPLDPPVVTLIQDTEFKLYTGKNFNGQIVHSWVANRTLTRFDMDFAPLLGFLSAQNMVPADVFLGTVQFGTETFSASSPVNFTVTSYQASMKAVNGKTEGTATVDGSVTDSGTANGPPVATAVAPSSVGVKRVSVSSAGTTALIIIAMLGVMFVI